MGEVYLAEQTNIGTRVALKLLQAEISEDQDHVRRFFNEARAVSRIQHAGIVKIFDVGFHPQSGQAYLVMEYLDGESLGRRIRRGRLTLAQVCDVASQLASVLDATHAAGITHRDLKPDNIYLVPDRELASRERVKILDFGIAKLSGTLAGASPRTYGTLGTPAYMAPEQWGDSSKVDWRADLYALGCVAFEMATGRPPFLATNFAEACAKHLTEPPPALSSIDPTVPGDLDQLLLRLLAKDPAQRPTTMREVAATFDEIGQHAGDAIVSGPTSAVPAYRPAQSDDRTERPADPHAATMSTTSGGVDLPNPTPTNAPTSRKREPSRETADSTREAALDIAREPSRDIAPEPSRAKSGRAGLFAGVAIGVAATGAIGFLVLHEEEPDDSRTAASSVPDNAPGTDFHPIPTLDAAVAVMIDAPPGPSIASIGALSAAFEASQSNFEKCIRAQKPDKIVEAKITLAVDTGGAIEKATFTGVPPGANPCLQTASKKILIAKPDVAFEDTFALVVKPKKPSGNVAGAGFADPIGDGPLDLAGRPVMTDQAWHNEAVRRLKAISEDVKRCASDTPNVVMVRVQAFVDAKGKVTSATATGASVTAARCIERLVRTVTFPANPSPKKPIAFPILIKREEPAITPPANAPNVLNAPNVRNVPNPPQAPSKQTPNEPPDEAPSQPPSPKPE